MVRRDFNFNERAFDRVGWLYGLHATLQDPGRCGTHADMAGDVIHSVLKRGMSVETVRELLSLPSASATPWQEATQLTFSLGVCKKRMNDPINELVVHFDLEGKLTFAVID